jgi:hypothetical protein
MELIDLMDLEVLAHSQFPTLIEAQYVITRSAARLGFALHLSSSSKQPYVRFHCYKGGKPAKARAPELCRCSYRLVRQPDCTYRFGRCEVAHNHERVPAAFADLLLSDEMREYVAELHRIGVPPLKIQLALEARGVLLSSPQIQNMCKPGHLKAFTDSSEGLIGWVINNGGSVVTYQEQIHHETARVAVFTQMPDELLNLQQWGDVIEIDGTHAPMKTNWEVIPITVMDAGRHIHAGGIVFAVFVTTEVIAWILQVLLDSCPALREIWRSLITDEDSAFIPAVEQIARLFNHILCAMHKEGNFLKKLNRCGLSKPDRERAARLFRQLAYSDHRGYARSCLDEILRMDVPRLTKYITKHITPRLNNFAKSFLPDVFNCGLNTTSAAESMNRLLKLGMRPNMCMAEARDWFTTRLRQHKARLDYHRLHRRSVPIELEVQLGSSFEPEIRHKIEAVIDDANDCEFRPGGREGETLVHSRRLSDVAYVVTYDPETERYECSCGMMLRQGYMCVHQYVVIVRDGAPLHRGYFNPRWMREAHDPQEGSDKWTADDMPSDDDIAAINREDGTEESLLELHEWNVDRTLAELPLMSQRSAYLTLFHFAKTLCSSASRDTAGSCALFSRLNELHMELVEVSIPVPVPEIGQEAPIGDVQDAVPRSRGRPKKRQIPNHTVRAAKRRKGTELILECDLCEASHLLEACRYYHIVMGARLANGPIFPIPGQRKCALCWGYGHQKRTCPCRRELQALLQMHQHQDEEEEPELA